MNHDRKRLIETAQWLRSQLEEWNGLKANWTEAQQDEFNISLGLLTLFTLKDQDVVAMLNERLEERTQGMLDSLARARYAPSAMSFRAGWEAAMDYHNIPNRPWLEEALQKHLNPVQP